MLLPSHFLNCCFCQRHHHFCHHSFHSSPLLYYCHDCYCVTLLFMFLLLASSLLSSSISSHHHHHHLHPSSNHHHVTVITIIIIITKKLSATQLRRGKNLSAVHRRSGRNSVLRREREKSGATHWTRETQHYSDKQGDTHSLMLFVGCLTLFIPSNCRGISLSGPSNFQCSGRKTGTPTK